MTDPSAPPDRRWRPRRAAGLAALLLLMGASLALALGGFPVVNESLTPWRELKTPAPPPAWPAPAGLSAPRPAPVAASQIWRVGPGEAIRSVESVARLAQDGDVVEIAAGDYIGQVAVWRQRRLTIRSVGGNARMHAGGRSAEGKAIWVLRHGDFDITGIDFIGAQAPDRNGAGIRFEGGHLRLSHCLFWGNENGVLTSAGPEASLTVENSEFGYNGHGDGFSHALYAGLIGRLRVVGSYFHHGKRGHLIKSRAAFTELFYNRLTDEAGQASYEIDLPNGGEVLILGNVIQQGRESRNRSMVAYGAEGYRHGNNTIQLIHNTLVDELPGGGSFLRLAPGAQGGLVANNVLVGAGELKLAPPVLEGHNLRAVRADLVDAEHFDYRPRQPWPVWQRSAAGPAPAPNPAASQSPQAFYRHPRSVQVLPSDGPALVGALPAQARAR